MGSVDAPEGATAYGPTLAPIGIPVFDATGRKVGHVLAAETDGVVVARGLIVRKTAVVRRVDVARRDASGLHLRVAREAVTGEVAPPSPARYAGSGRRGSLRGDQ